MESIEAYQDIIGRPDVDTLHFYNWRFDPEPWLLRGQYVIEYRIAHNLPAFVGEMR